jgi:hypothetical protein
MFWKRKKPEVREIDPQLGFDFTPWTGDYYRLMQADLQITAERVGAMNSQKSLEAWMLSTILTVS